ncbi:diaminopimelate epimerase [Rhodomicrobium udaipurense JA643]|uniref:Diaminopimelate epimerase n=1 Tax=Rhodomicrobium udaipurense TaxID=1202716 RepID=A0A8I1G9R1_9HYPH|nr:diaminopimelate epimerase [Rhodomicrobium udaipurense]KAI95486.1 diaminopimelate epimerase [Rhodomicrobium udaipurense JA643]MBJ7543138.1 diaminopimelate epimerase [Rhodomicrobium udaipurense]
MAFSHISFKKMNGLGNDFAVLDARANGVRLTADEASGIANRETGVGCDQVIVLEPSSRADVFMRILNADGSEVGACGNASRCVGALLAAELGRERVTIETAAGVLDARIAGNGLVTVDMGAPHFGWRDIPLAKEEPDTRAISLAITLPDGRVLEGPSVANVGNPHAIFWVADVDAYDLATFGGALEYDPIFPERANISLAEVIDGSAVKLRVWERGAGITQACGTAACATAVSAARTGRTGRTVEIRLPGGVIGIEWRADDDHILMTGPVAHEFEGTLTLSGGGVTVARES